MPGTDGVQGEPGSDGDMGPPGLRGLPGQKGEPATIPANLVNDGQKGQKGKLKKANFQPKFTICNFSNTIKQSLFLATKFFCAVYVNFINFLKL